MEKYMEMACKSANEGMNNNEGGPFGAVIIKDNKIVSVAHNTVLKSNDPTAHAEVNAIRMAGKELNTFDLKDCTLITTSEPCPMCMSAIIWANIKTVYYGTNRKDVAKIGFRDDYIYNYLSDKEEIDIKKEQLIIDDCKEILAKYKNTIY